MTKRWIAAAVAVLLVFGGGAFLFIFTGAFNVAADEPHWEITRKIIEFVRGR